MPLLILGGATALLVYSGWRSLQSAIEVRVMPVVSRPAGVQQEQPAGGETADGAPSVQAPGWIEPDPFPVSISALAEGVVERVHILEGESVNAGDVVAELNDESAVISLAQAEAEILIAQAEIEVARADVESARSTWENPTERTRAVAVAEAELAASHAELAEHDAQLALEQARLAETRDEHDRLSRSSQLQAAAPGEFARVKLRLAAQEHAVEALRAHRPVIEAHARHHEAELHAAKESQRLRIQERRALASAEANLAGAEAHLAQDRAKRDEAALVLSRMKVVSPITGVVMTRLVEPGSRIMHLSDEPHASHIARLYDPARLQVRVDIPLSEAAKVGVGQRAQITTEALPDAVFEGVVTRRVDEANIQKNTVQVKVAIEKPSPILRPEMLARVRFFGAAFSSENAPVAAGRDRLFVPGEALVDRNEREARAWLVDRRGGRAALRTIGLSGAQADGWHEVVEGLRPGDRLIVSPPGNLREGARVRVVAEGGRSSAASPDPARGHGS